MTLSGKIKRTISFIVGNDARSTCKLSTEVCLVNCVRVIQESGKCIFPENTTSDQELVAFFRDLEHAKKVAEKEVR